MAGCGAARERAWAVATLSHRGDVDVLCEGGGSTGGNAAAKDSAVDLGGVDGVGAAVVAGAAGGVGSADAKLGGSGLAVAGAAGAGGVPGHFWVPDATGGAE